jgi:hypothetical protein
LPAVSTHFSQRQCYEAVVRDAQYVGSQYNQPVAKTLGNGFSTSLANMELSPINLAAFTK